MKLLEESKIKIRWPSNDPSIQKGGRKLIERLITRVFGHPRLTLFWMALHSVKNLKSSELSDKLFENENHSMAENGILKKGILKASRLIHSN